MLLKARYSNIHNLKTSTNIHLYLSRKICKILQKNHQKPGLLLFFKFFKTFKGSLYVIIPSIESFMLFDSFGISKSLNLSFKLHFSISFAAYICVCVCVCVKFAGFVQDQFSSFKT